MKKLLLLSILFFVLTFNNLSAQPLFDWAISVGSTSSDMSLGITTDSSGNTYVSGLFWGTVDFDPGPDTLNLTSNGLGDGFIKKLDPYGNLIWAKSYGGTGGESANAIMYDETGHITLTGNFQNTVDFDPGVGVSNLVSTGMYDGFVLRLDTNGNFVWAKSFGGTDDEEANSLVIDENTNIYITGAFAGTADFDPSAGVFNLSSSGNEDVFILKLDAQGNFVWAKALNGSLENKGMYITVDAFGDLCLTGYFNSTVDFDPGPALATQFTVGGDDVFIEKLDTNGNFIWAKTFGGGTSDKGFSIVTDNVGNIYVTGLFNGSPDFDPGTGTFTLNSNGGDDVFIEKLDVNGDFLWATAIGGTSGDRGFSIALDGQYNVYSIGEFQGTVDFNPGAGTDSITSSGASDIYLQKLDSSGSYQWTLPIGSASGTELCRQVIFDKWYNTYIIGSFFGTIDLDPDTGTYNVTSNGVFDAYTLKLNDCPPIMSTDVITSCDSLTWIDGNTYYASTYTPTHTIIAGAVNGCDSIVTLDLTINSVNVSTILSNDTITALDSGATYQWLNCDSSYSIISGETGQSYIATASGNYAVQVTQNGCVDTSSCYNIIFTGNEFLNGNNYFKVYPNPSIQYIVIESIFNQPISFLKVINNLEQEVLQVDNINKTSFKIDMSNLHNGLYMLYIYSSEKISIKKIIKE